MRSVDDAEPGPTRQAICASACRFSTTVHYTERGFTILDEEQRWGWDPERVPMRFLQRHGDDGEPEGVDESVITDPQHWAVWLDKYTEYVDCDGNVVEEDEIDWDTADDADAEPDEGLRHADCVRERPAFAPEWFCLDPEAAGLQVSEMYQRNADWYAPPASRSNPRGGPRCRQPRQLRAEAERAEAERRERRKLITLNKLGAAAIEVRRQFVTTLLARCRARRRSWPTAWPATVTC
jgi:ParB family transcriptional regulator, chromosome partitioning protein